MAYHEELLAQADDLIHRNEPNSTQADFRRAISTCYYALFHLLIDETTLNWSRDSSRAALGRMFDHALMRRASQRLVDPRLFPFEGENLQVVEKLKSVASAFVRLQNRRELADYHNGVHWTLSEALREVATAQDAFLAWTSIRNEDIAQEYLVSLRIKSRD